MLHAEEVLQWSEDIAETSKLELQYVWATVRDEESATCNVVHIGLHGILHLHAAVIA